jgi:peptidoglycan/LPS O-acetylase OafA/YrhL
LLINIQALRFVAAMLVALYHASSRLQVDTGPGQILLDFGRATGYAGVDIFFVISGFIMAHTTLEKTGRSFTSQFVRRRLARIFSGYWPFFLFALMVFSWTRPEHVEESNLLASFFLWPQLLPHTLLEVTWTLSFELYFYFLFALLLLWAPPGRRAVICLILALIVMALAAYRYWEVDSFGPSNLWKMPFAEHFLIAPYVAQFFAGSVLAYVLHRRPKGRGLPWFFVGCATFIAGGFLNQGYYDGNIEQGYYVVPRVLVFGSASLMIVWGLVRLEHAGIVAHKGMSLLGGGASYAVYLIHIPLLSLSWKLGLGGWIDGQHPWVAFATTVALLSAIAGLAMLHFSFIERPLHRLFKTALNIS